MKFTILVVVLVLTHVYPVANTDGSITDPGTSTVKDPECEVVEKNQDKKMNLYCMNETTVYGYLTYYVKKSSKSLYFKAVRSRVPASKRSIEIVLLDVGEDYRQKGVATLFLNYFIDNIARKGRFQQIELTVVDGKQNAGAKKLYENAGFEWVPRSRDEMIKKLSYTE